MLVLRPIVGVRLKCESFNEYAMIGSDYCNTGIGKYDESASAVRGGNSREVEISITN